MCALCFCKENAVINNFTVSNQKKHTLISYGNLYLWRDFKVLSNKT